MIEKLKAGHVLQLIPRNPPAPKSLPGLCMVGRLIAVEYPKFWFEEWAGRAGWEFRGDENCELAVRVSDNSLWEIGLCVPPDAVLLSGGDPRTSPDQSGGPQ